MNDPFATGLFGGLPKTATEPASPSMSATTAPTDTETGESATSSSAPEKRSRSARKRATPCSSGGNSSTTAASLASTVPCSETSPGTSRRSLSDRLTQSLITAGLVKGITPTSTRQQFGQPIRVLAFDTPDGGAAE